MRLTRSLVTFVFAVVVLCGGAFADTINFGGLGGDLGSNSHTFTSRILQPLGYGLYQY